MGQAEEEMGCCEETVADGSRMVASSRTETAERGLTNGSDHDPVFKPRSISLSILLRADSQHTSFSDFFSEVVRKTVDGPRTQLAIALSPSAHEANQKVPGTGSLHHNGKNA